MLLNYFNMNVGIEMFFKLMKFVTVRCWLFVEFFSFIGQALNQNLLQQAHRNDETHVMCNSNDNGSNNRDCLIYSLCS